MIDKIDIHFVEACEKAKQRYPIEAYPYASEGLQRAYVEGFSEAWHILSSKIVSLIEQKQEFIREQCANYEEFYQGMMSGIILIKDFISDENK